MDNISNFCDLFYLYGENLIGCRDKEISNFATTVLNKTLYRNYDFLYEQPDVDIYADNIGHLLNQYRDSSFYTSTYNMAVCISKHKRKYNYSFNKCSCTISCKCKCYNEYHFCKYCGLGNNHHICQDCKCVGCISGRDKWNLILKIYRLLIIEKAKHKFCCSIC